jgi:hypothetical protein
MRIIEELRNLRIEKTQNLTKCLKLNKLFTTLSMVSATLAHFLPELLGRRVGTFNFKLIMRNWGIPSIP